MTSNMETINVTVDSSGNIIRYFCNHVTLNNPNLNKIYVPFAYEMKYDCSTNSTQSINDGIVIMEETMLFKLKNVYLADVSSCSTPQTLWFSSIDARPSDVYEPARPCTNFNVSGDPNSCCVSIQGNMTFTEISSVGERLDDLLTEASNAVAASNGSAGYQVMYLGADMQITTTTGQDNIGAATNGDLPTDALVPKNSDSFTVLGSFVLLFLVLCFVGVLGFVLYQRQRSKRASEFGDAVRKSEHGVSAKDGDELSLVENDEEQQQQLGWIEPRRLPTRDAEPEPFPPPQPMETNVLTDDDQDDIYIRSIASQPFRDASSQVLPSARNSSRPRSDYRWDDFDQEEKQQHEDPHQQNATLLSYVNGQQKQQDSSNSGSNGGQLADHPYSYSIGGIAVVPAFPGEVSASELSDADSWAQTEGTVGSLDERDQY